MAPRKLRVHSGSRIIYNVKPTMSDVLGSNVLIRYGIAEVLASTSASTVEGGCIRPGDVISCLMHCWYPIGDEMKTQRLSIVERSSNPKIGHV